MATKTKKPVEIDASTMALIEAAANAAWPIDDVVLVVTMARAGMSAYDIAAAMTPIRSRNAVAGKIDRLVTQGINTGRRNRALARRRKATPETQPVTSADTYPPRHVAGPKTLQQLQHTCCRWPMGDTSPGDPAFRFCGEHKIEGLPYCDAHAKIAYVPPQLPARVVEANAQYRALIES